MIIERFPNLLSGLFIQSEESRAGLRSRENDQQRTLDQRRRPARHLLHLIFPPNVFLPDNSPCFHIQAVRNTIGSHDINPLLLHYRGRRWAGSAFGHKSPFAIMLFVDIIPKHLARLFLEAMQALAGGGFGQFHIKYKHPSLRHHRTRESAADRMPPADFQALRGK